MSAFGSCKRDKQGCLVSTEPGTSSEQMVHIGGTGGQQEVGKKAVPKNPSERKWREAQLCRVQVRPSHHAPYGHTKPCQGMATGMAVGNLREIKTLRKKMSGQEMEASPQTLRCQALQGALGCRGCRGHAPITAHGCARRAGGPGCADTGAASAGSQ